MQVQEINFTEPYEAGRPASHPFCDFPKGTPPIAYILCAIYTIICFIIFMTGVYFHFQNLIDKKKFRVAYGYNRNQQDVAPV